MSRAYNFSAGPATLPEAVLEQARDEMLDFRGVGASIVELSHRGPEFMQVAAEAEADLRTLMSIPDDYAVLFLSGGATTQQALIALNSAAPGQGADYVITGHWGKTAIKQVTPYVAARVGKAMASFDESYGGTSDADGWMYGLGAGVLWPLAKAVQVDGAVHYARVSHDYGSGDYSDSEKGNLISMRAGVRIFR